MTDKVQITETEDGLELRSTDFEALQEKKDNIIKFPAKAYGFKSGEGLKYEDIKYEVKESEAIPTHDLKYGEPIEFYIFLKKI